MNSKCETGIFEYRQKYPYSETILLFTEFQNLGQDNIDGLIANLIQLSNLTDAPEVRKLVPKSNLSVLTNKKEVFINAVEFLAYTGEDQLEAGHEYQSPYATDDELALSLLSEIWQPNFFRPAIYVGTENVASGMNNANLQPFSDLAVGLPSQFCYQVNKVVQNPQDIYITAALAKAIKTENGTKYRNYPMLAIVSIRK